MKKQWISSPCPKNVLWKQHELGYTQDTFQANKEKKFELILIQGTHNPNHDNEYTDLLWEMFYSKQTPLIKLNTHSSTAVLATKN